MLVTVLAFRRCCCLSIFKTTFFTDYKSEVCLLWKIEIILQKENKITYSPIL